MFESLNDFGLWSDYHYSNRERQCDLALASRVCRVFYRLIVPLLYGSPSLLNPGRATLLLQTLKENNHLRKLPWSLDWKAHNGLIRDGLLADFAVTLQATLEALHVGPLTLFNFASEGHARIDDNMPSLPHLRTFSYEGGPVPGSLPFWDGLVPFLTPIEGLKSLAIAGVYVSPPIELPVPASLSARQLTSFELRNCIVDPSAFEWMVQSPIALEHLVCWNVGEVPLALLEDLLQRHSRHLRSLEFGNDAYGGRWTSESTSSWLIQGALLPFRFEYPKLTRLRLGTACQLKGRIQVPYRSLAAPHLRDLVIVTGDSSRLEAGCTSFLLASILVTPDDSDLLSLLRPLSPPPGDTLAELETLTLQGEKPSHGAVHRLRRYCVVKGVCFKVREVPKQKL